MTTSDAAQAWGPWLAWRAAELKVSIFFSTRLPFAPQAPIDGPRIAQAAWAFPIAGILVGVVGSVVYALAHRLGLPAWPAAALSVTATLAVTGCLHEDGLADTADGFGGGRTRGQKLAIMRDSRIGTYGVCALVLALLLRASALASLVDPTSVAAALLAAHAGARAAMPVLMFAVAPARSDGLSFGAGRPSGRRVAAAVLLGVLVLAGSLGLRLGIEAAISLTVVVAIMARLTLRQIGGQTGDVVGALEQVGEVVVLLVASR